MNKEVAIKTLRELWRETNDSWYEEVYKMAIEALQTNVVRCKDCKHRDEKCGMGEHRWCKILKMSTVPNDFCSYAERREP